MRLADLFPFSLLSLLFSTSHPRFSPLARLQAKSSTRIRAVEDYGRGGGIRTSLLYSDSQTELIVFLLSTSITPHSTPASNVVAPASPPASSSRSLIQQDKNKREALERQAANEAAADEKTAKNRLKRQRQKDARSKGKKPSGGAASASAAGGVDGDAAVGDKKRKLAGGAAFKFKSVEEREAEDEEENDEDAPARKPELKLAQPAFADDAELRRLQEEEERAAPAKEAGITIQDDD